MTVTLTVGDCRDVLAGWEAGSVDACVCDPPYDLTDVGRKFQGKGGTEHPHGRPNPRSEQRRGGFMGQGWDATGVAFDPATWQAVKRVLKPGAPLLAFGGTRTWHRLAVAIEDAGFQIVDTIMWLHGQGFPKHKTLLKPAFEPIVVAKKPGTGGLRTEAGRIGGEPWTRPNRRTALGIMNDDGWQPTPMDGESHPDGRWPANVVLSHLETCREVGVRRVKGSKPATFHASAAENNGNTSATYGKESRHEGHVTTGYADPDGYETVSAWECADGCPVAMLDAQSGDLPSGNHPAHRVGIGFGSGAKGTDGPGRSTDGGGASRFLYCAKADRTERDRGLPLGTKNDHVSVKPVSLMQWLVRLAAAPGGTVVDPFCGSGTTGVACEREGVHFRGVDLSEHYIDIARYRIRGDAPLFADVSVA